MRLSDRSPADLVTLAFGVAVLVALAYAASTSGAAYSPFNPDWDGTSELRSEADAAGADHVVVSETAEYGSLPADGSVALILAPDEPYDSTAAADVREFAEAGGTVVVADSSGTHANPLLDAIGANARIDGEPLRDERQYHRSPAFPVASDAADHPYADDGDGLTLNRGSAIESADATVLVRSSEFAYLDANRNERLDEDETMAAHPVVTYEEVGDGRVVTVSDASVFINVMLERPGNRAFVQSTFADHDRVAFDVSHSQDAPPARAAASAIRESSAAQLLLGTAVVLALAGARGRAGIGTWLRKRASRSLGRDGARTDVERLESKLLERHPEWDERRRERVVRAILPNRDDDRDDG